MYLPKRKPKHKDIIFNNNQLKKKKNYKKNSKLIKKKISKIRFQGNKRKC